MIFNISDDYKWDSGVYQIKNKVTGSVYIGKSINFFQRYTLHLQTLRNGTHFNMQLQNDYNKYGADNFEFSCIEIAESDSLLNREQHFIELFDSINTGYNLKIAYSGREKKQEPPTPVRLPDELKTLLSAQAEKENRALSNMVITIVKEYYQNKK